MQIKVDYKYFCDRFIDFFETEPNPDRTSGGPIPIFSGILDNRNKKLTIWRRTFPFEFIRYEVSIEEKSGGFLDFHGSVVIEKMLRIWLGVAVVVAIFSILIASILLVFGSQVSIKHVLPIYIVSMVFLLFAVILVKYNQSRSNSFRSQAETILKSLAMESAR